MHDHHHRRDGHHLHNGHGHHDHDHRHDVASAAMGSPRPPATTLPRRSRNGRTRTLTPAASPDAPEPDFDLVESAFAESFPTASDPTSFLRLAGIPFAGRSADGTMLNLLRVEFEETTDVAAVTPHLGGGSVRVDPLPAQMVSRRRHLRFAYQGRSEIVRLSLAEARSLEVL